MVTSLRVRARATATSRAVTGQRPSTVRQVTAPVVVLNGGSSSGKTSIARCLQKLLGPTWMLLGVDDLIRALPRGDEIDELIGSQHGLGTPVGTQGSIQFGTDGSVSVGEDFRRAEASWYAGLAAIGRCATGLIVDEVFMGGRSSQERLATALSDLPVLWVGVRCEPDIATARERGRPDRVAGMARLQAERVHQGVVYDMVVDTTSTSASDCARAVVSRLRQVDTAQGQRQ